MDLIIRNIDPESIHIIDKRIDQIKINIPKFQEVSF